MGRDHHHSRLVTLGEALGAVAESGTLAAMAMASLPRALVGAAFGARREECDCGGVRHHYSCCTQPPRCGGCC